MEEKRQEQSWEETESWNFSGGKGKQTGDNSKMAAWANRAERRAGVDRWRPAVRARLRSVESQ